ncbi:DedA family protein [Aciditerrimonas ferrireducens]|uniref:DedA family protein n=1 Tax=Aciditerrimonas ferrireducens TaxID=667306 RepID=A0ABV6C6I2_9ACTN
MSAPPPLPGIFRPLGPLVSRDGYLAVGGLVLLEDFGVPVPGETILVVAAVFAGAGRLSILGVALVGFAGAVVGDSVGYLIGRLGGRALVLRLGRFVGLTERRLQQGEAFVQRHGAPVVVVARFVEGLRQANGILAGALEMPWLTRFLPANALGAALWVGLWTTVGSLAGQHLDAIYGAVVHAELAAVVVAVVVLAAVVVWRVRRRRRERAGEPPR